MLGSRIWSRVSEDNQTSSISFLNDQRKTLLYISQGSWSVNFQSTSTSGEPAMAAHMTCQRTPQSILSIAMALGQSPNYGTDLIALSCQQHIYASKQRDGCPFFVQLTFFDICIHLCTKFRSRTSCLFFLTIPAQLHIITHPWPLYIGFSIRALSLWKQNDRKQTRSVFHSPTLLSNPNQSFIRFRWSILWYKLFLAILPIIGMEHYQHSVRSDAPGMTSACTHSFTIAELWWEKAWHNTLQSGQGVCRLH